MWNFAYILNSMRATCCQKIWVIVGWKNSCLLQISVIWQAFGWLWNELGVLYLPVVSASIWGVVEVISCFTNTRLKGTSTINHHNSIHQNSSSTILLRSEEAKHWKIFIWQMLKQRRKKSVKLWIWLEGKWWDWVWLDDVNWSVQLPIAQIYVDLF